MGLLGCGHLPVTQDIRRVRSSYAAPIRLKAVWALAPELIGVINRKVNNTNLGRLLVSGNAVRVRKSTRNNAVNAH